MKNNLRAALEVAAALLVAAPAVKAGNDYAQPAATQTSPWDVQLDQRAFAKSQKKIAKNEVRAYAHTIVGKPLVAADATGRFTLRGARYDGHMVAVDTQTIVLDNVKQGKDGTDPTPVVVNNTSASGIGLGVQVITGVANGVGQAFDVFGLVANCFHGGGHGGNGNVNESVKENVTNISSAKNLTMDNSSIANETAISKNGTAVTKGNNGFSANGSTQVDGNQTVGGTGGSNNNNPNGNAGSSATNAARPATTTKATVARHTK